MSRLGEELAKCFVAQQLDLKLLMEKYSINFRNLSLDDVLFIESECIELRQKFKEAEKVECYKTCRLCNIGWGETAYFSLDEIDLVKSLAEARIKNGDFDFEIKKVKTSKDVLTGHIRDRKGWEAI